MADSGIEKVKWLTVLPEATFLRKSACRLTCEVNIYVLMDAKEFVLFQFTKRDESFSLRKRNSKLACDRSYFMSWKKLFSFILYVMEKILKKSSRQVVQFPQKQTILSKKSGSWKRKLEWLCLFWKIFQPKFDIGLIQTARCDLVVSFFNHIKRSKKSWRNLLVK